MKYLVVGSKGPGFASEREAIGILEEMAIPSFEQLIKLEKEKKILAGGLPVGERAMVFIIEAPSNEKLDQMLRKLPLWGALEWKVTALQSFAGRRAIDAAILKELKEQRF